MRFHGTTVPKDITLAGCRPAVSRESITWVMKIDSYGLLYLYGLLPFPEANAHVSLLYLHGLFLLPDVNAHVSLHCCCP